MTSTLTLKKSPRRFLWLQRILAIIALVNLLLVFFDLSYIHWRDFYFRHFPEVTQFYDQVKGIEPNRDTQNYLKQVNQLEALVAAEGLQSPEVETALAELRLLSNQMIEDNPFAIANKSGLLEKIKNQMRDRLVQNSAHQAFNKFWSSEYFSQVGWSSEINFFNSSIRPLLETNYYRHIDINSKFVDDFWKLDLPFIILFALDYLVRTFAISSRDPNLTWLEAMLRRWYDLFLLLPFWRWLRVVPVLIRLNQSELVDFKPFRSQINRDFVANFAQEMTEVVGIRMIDGMQNSINRGDVANWMFNSESRRPYVDINNINELRAIASRLICISVYDVLPQVQPDVETLLQYIIKSVLNQSPVYRQLQNIPGVNKVPNQLAENLAKDISQTSYKTLKAALEDPEVAKLASQLVTNFEKVLEEELQKKHNFQEIENLLIDMLEEIKINYIKDIEQEGVEKTLDESSQLRQIIQ
ncbi:hypothetical protein IQ264_09705 [Phormidium sp. LEGE 05292]|uniref:hypothetical protein n=1 Tax=[Phormidium] sp. LEGE 05292 TaxID=767427 RepID=UPI00187E1468|nr:hypothetical protein [Phormidium sp. LEGE 05292]MBE9225696.1 hypothetical protein [Phormidium sp. LEGE 05292]